MSAEQSRQVIVWVPPAERPENIEEARRKAQQAEVRALEIQARQAQAERRLRQCQINETAEKLVLTQLEKLLRLAQSPDFENSPGPVDVKDLIKLAELAGKEYRLDTGKATANVAHRIGPSIDFSKMTQDERNEWRRLVAKGGGTADDIE